MAVANTTRRTVRRVPKRARQLRTAVIGIAIVALSVTPNVAASTARPAPFGDDGPQLQALVGDPAELDATFGTGGKVMTNTGGNLATAVAIQSDGKIVVAGGGIAPGPWSRATRAAAHQTRRSTMTASPTSMPGSPTWPSSPMARLSSSGRVHRTASAAKRRSPGSQPMAPQTARFDSDGIATIGLGTFHRRQRGRDPDATARLLIGGGERVQDCQVHDDGRP